MAMKVQGGQMVPTGSPVTRMARTEAQKAVTKALYTLREALDLSGVGLVEPERRKLMQAQQLLSGLASELDRPRPTT